MVYRTAVRARYEAALSIPGGSEPIARTHGHGYTVEAVLEVDRLDGSGFVVDFEVAQQLLERVASELDHRFLNRLEAFEGETPSAERQAAYFYSRLTPVVDQALGSGVRIAKVRVIQEPDAWAEYEP